ncbi:hypothetical protein [uncultured Microscilla sp.]|uniref:hypothetical protein n=1 Tax=uncultured Microscilla sp. TaxID=432653 RepID=UPI0026319191|nr:hypothetical protein [uncultured Microscilla sp.]
MRKQLLFTTLLLVSCVFQGFAQKKLWRVIKLDKYPNTAYTPCCNDFRTVLLEGMKDKKLTAYFYTGKFGDATQAVSMANLQGFSKNFGKDKITSGDFNTLELHEDYYPDKNQFDIKAMSIIIKAKGKVLGLLFKYDEAKKHLDNAYNASLPLHTYEALKAFWQSPEDPTVQWPVTKALKQRKFASIIPRSIGLPLPMLARLRGKDYRAVQTEIWYPGFVRVDLENYRTTISYKLPLTDAENKAFYQAKEAKGVLAEELLEGIRSGKLTPYQVSPIRANKPLVKQDAQKLESKLYYLNSSKDSIPLQGTDIQKLRLDGHWTINKKSGKRNFKIARITLIVTTNDALKGVPKHLAQLDYKEVKSYLDSRYEESKKEKKATLKKKEKGIAVWINPEKPDEKKSFTEALDKGLYKAHIHWFANRTGKDVQALAKSSSMSTNEARKRVHMYLDGFGKK